MKKHLFLLLALALAVVAFAPLLAQNVSATIDDYYPQGTKWTELRMPEDYDNTNDSWYLEKYVDGVLTWVPNYEVVNFYVEGDTVNSYGEHLYVVYKDTKKSKHLRAFYLGDEGNRRGEHALCNSVLRFSWGDFGVVSFLQFRELEYRKDTLVWLPNEAFVHMW